MKKIGIATDSHSGIMPEEAARLGVSVLPAAFYVNGKIYYENVDLSREDFFRMQDRGDDIKTSQPSTLELTSFWNDCLKDHDQILYIPISSGLSGSCNTASLLAEDPPYKGRVYVVDNGRVSVPQYCTILDALKMVESGMEIGKIRNLLEKYRADEVIYISIDDINHLKKGGRLSTSASITAFILNIKPVLMFDTGKLNIYKKARGMSKAKAEMFSAVKNDLETRFRSWYDNGEYYLMTATSANQEDNDNFVHEVQEHFPGTKVYSSLLPLAVCAHIGYRSYGIGISCKPLY